MTFKALLYQCYVRRGPKSEGSKEQEGRALMEFLVPSGQSGAHWL